jgi:hypothetical protein
MPEQTTRRFLPPWRVERIDGGYVVRDANGQSLVYVWNRENVRMVRQQVREEFAEVVKENIRQDEPRTREAAIGFKTWRNTKNTLELARRTARQTRITMMLAGVAVVLLILASYLLWRILEHLPKI